MAKIVFSWAEKGKKTAEKMFGGANFFMGPYCICPSFNKITKNTILGNSNITCGMQLRVSPP